MIVLLVLISLSLGTVLGWFAHKVSLRIEVWGIHMNEQDRSLQEIVDAGDIPDIAASAEHAVSMSAAPPAALISAKHSS